MLESGGRDLSVFDEGFFAQTVERRMQATGTGALRAYAEYVAAHPDESVALASSLVVTYSEFFRDPLPFAVLEGIALPSLALARTGERRREIRVWSAACATGEEAWSLAILLHDLAESTAAARSHELGFRIFATDLGEPELEAARRGVYDERSVRNVRAGQLARHFVARGDSYQVAPSLRPLVDFSQFDLLDATATCAPASIYGDFDVVLCCNVLFYYCDDVQRSILSKIRRCLSSRGVLMTGEVERAMVLKAGGFRAIAGPAPVFSKVA